MQAGVLCLTPTASCKVKEAVKSNTDVRKTKKHLFINATLIKQGLRTGHSFSIGRKNLIMSVTAGPCSLLLRHVVFVFTLFVFFLGSAHLSTVTSEELGIVVDATKGTKLIYKLRFYFSSNPH